MQIMLYNNEFGCKAGIYVIHNTETDRWYVCESKKLRSRFLQHEKDLAEGTHCNRGMRFDARVFGAWNFDEFLVIHDCDGLSDKERRDYETCVIDTMKDCGYLLYNERKA